MTIALVAAVARNGAIGRDNALLWHLPEDLQRFRALTLGHPVLMGRRTWESIPSRFRPLPARRNVVVSRQADWRAEGAESARDLDEALRLARVPAEGIDAADVFVIGGAELYGQALPLADMLHLTEIDRDYQDAHAWFPSWRRQDFVEVARERHHAGPPNDFDYAFTTYRRRKP